jgi:hypothetical protein
VIRSVVGGAFALVAIGVALGLGVAAALARFVQSLLFGVEVTGHSDVCRGVGAPAHDRRGRRILAGPARLLHCAGRRPA